MKKAKPIDFMALLNSIAKIEVDIICSDVAQALSVRHLLLNKRYSILTKEKDCRTVTTMVSASEADSELKKLKKLIKIKGVKVSVL